MKAARNHHRARKLQGRRSSHSKLTGRGWPPLTMAQVHRALAALPLRSDGWYRWNRHYPGAKSDPGTWRTRMHTPRGEWVTPYRRLDFAT